MHIESFVKWCVLQIIMTKEIVQKHMQSLQSHPNATVETYEVAMDEYDIRKLITHANRATGTSTIAESFGLPAHSASLLEDEQLHQKIKVGIPEALSWPFICMYLTHVMHLMHIYINAVLTPHCKQSCRWSKGSHLQCSV